MSRLIDADALAEGYKHMGYDPNEHPEESYMEGWCKGFNAAVDHCLHHVIHAPTIEPRKGRWETDSYPMDDGEYLMTRCTACGTAYEYGHNENYCGFCGAEMDGGQNGKNS